MASCRPNRSREVGQQPAWGEGRAPSLGTDPGSPVSSMLGSPADAVPTLLCSVRRPGVCEHAPRPQEQQLTIGTLMGTLSGEPPSKGCPSSSHTMPLLPQGQCPRPSAPSPTALAPGSPSAVSGGRWSSTGGSSRPQARWPQSCILHGSPLQRPRSSRRPAVIPPPRRLRHCGVTRPPLPVQIRTAGGFSFEKVTRPRWSATGVGVGWGDCPPT